MNPSSTATGSFNEQSNDNISYIRQMLGQLRGVAQAEGADLLCYLIEMAYVEAGDLQAGDRPLSSKGASVPGIERNKAAGMAVQASGKVKL